MAMGFELREMLWIHEQTSMSSIETVRSVVRVDGRIGIWDLA
jgi:hypothetical protein